MKTFAEYCLLEMARPASSFADLDMNQAYAESLKKFRDLGVMNANTYTIWDFMFRQLPEFFHHPVIEDARKKASGTKQRQFVLGLLKKFPNHVDLKQLAHAINDVEAIKSYINRPERGNRHQGMVNAQQSSVNKMGLNPQSSDFA